MTHTLTIERYDAEDPRLGRHVHHDSRSLEYLFLPRDAQPKKINVTWASHYAPLNQGHTGSCTGNATAQCLNTNFHAPTRKKAHHNRKLSEGDALKIYSLGTHLDNYPGAFPPQDTGCDGLSVAKAATQMGLLNEYLHLVSFSSVQAAIELSPAIQGTVWTKPMFTPNNGLVKVGPINDSTIAGGHEYAFIGIDWNEEVHIYRNSWGNENDWPGCKPGGYFAIGFKDVAALLAQQGDVTVLHGVAQTP